MKNTLFALAAISTLALVVDFLQASSALVPRWSLFLILAVCLSGMAYYRWCYEQVERQRNEMQDQLIRLLPKYSERMGARPDGDGRPTIHRWADLRTSLRPNKIQSDADDDADQSPFPARIPVEETELPNSGSAPPR